MTAYLVNLARRSAGLAPTVRARASAAAPSDEGGADAAAADLGPVRGGSAASGDVAPAVTAPVVLRVEMPVVGKSPATPVVPAMGVTPIAPTVQRAPIGASGTAQSVVVAPSAAPMRDHVDAHAAHHRTAEVAPAPQDKTAAAEIRSTPPEPTVITRSVERVIELTPAPVPIPSVAGERTSASVPDGLTRRVSDDDAAAQMTQPAAPPVRSGDALTVVIEPAPRADMAITAPPVRPEATVSMERTVHVRIGAIEIHGGDSAPPATPAAPAQPLAVAVSSQGSASGGFDDFVALRSYTPWAW